MQIFMQKSLTTPVISAFAVFLSVCMLHTVSAQEQQNNSITFQIDMRSIIRDTPTPFLPRVHKVGVRGNMSPLRWDSTLVASDSDGDGVYTITIKMTPPKSTFYEDTRIAYKFKVDGENLPSRGWEMTDNSNFNLTGSPQTIRRAFGELRKTPAFSTMSPRVKRHSDVASKILRNRSLYVLLPKDYESSTKRYPVVYMHDGQNMFDDSTSANGEWHFDEVLEGLVDSNRIPQVIVVGMAVDGSYRIEEYTPTPIQRQNLQGAPISLGGKAATHAQMLVEEIKPFIDKTYRTLQDRDNTTLGGSSLGGLATIFTGATYPQIFGKLFVISPSIWWDNQSILKIVKDAVPTMLKSASERQRIWLDIGDQEGKEALEGARALNKLLQAQGWKQGKTMQYIEAKNAAHSESAWAARLEPMLRFMFAPKK